MVVVAITGVPPNVKVRTSRFKPRLRTFCRLLCQVEPETKCGLDCQNLRKHQLLETAGDVIMKDTHRLTRSVLQLLGTYPPGISRHFYTFLDPKKWIRFHPPY